MLFSMYFIIEKTTFFNKEVKSIKYINRELLLRRKMTIDVGEIIFYSLKDNKLYGREKEEKK